MRFADAALWRLKQGCHLLTGTPLELQHPTCPGTGQSCQCHARSVAGDATARRPDRPSVDVKVTRPEGLVWSPCPARTGVAVVSAFLSACCSLALHIHSATAKMIATSPAATPAMMPVKDSPALSLEESDSVRGEVGRGGCGNGGGGGGGDAGACTTTCNVAVDLIGAAVTATPAKAEAAVALAREASRRDAVAAAALASAVRMDTRMRTLAEVTSMPTSDTSTPALSAKR